MNRREMERIVNEALDRPLDPDEMAALASRLEVQEQALTLLARVAPRDEAPALPPSLEDQP